MSTVFSKIIAGELPCYRIAESAHSFSFLAREQAAPGHTLVVSKREVDHIIDLPEPYYTDLFMLSKIVSRAIYQAFTPQRIGSMIQGFEIPHVHYHLIPLNNPQGLDLSKAQTYSEEKMLAIQEKIIAQI